MSVSQLLQLLESGQYEQCLAEASALLQEGQQSREAQARIYHAICRSQLALQDNLAAVAAGQQAVTLAAEAAEPDLHGFALVDLATALCRVRRWDEALDRLAEFLGHLDSYIAARCMEGIARQRQGEAFCRTAQHSEALAAFRQARQWFQRYGDERSAALCSRCMARIHLRLHQREEALAALQSAEEYAAANPWDREFLSDHCLDRAAFLLWCGDGARAAQEAFQGLEAADGRLHQQARSQLLLAECALAEAQFPEALSFAMAARVSAIDGRLYDLEFEASDLVFRLLREHGEGLLCEVEGDFRAAGVDIYQYLSEKVIRRLLGN